jgi:hypothetical protein
MSVIRDYCLALSLQSLEAFTPVPLGAVQVSR